MSLCLVLSTRVVSSGCRTRSEGVELLLLMFFVTLSLGLALMDKHGCKLKIDVCLNARGDWISSCKSIQTALLRSDMKVSKVNRVARGCSHAVLVIG